MNAIRAVFTEDMKLMEKVFFDKKNISTLNAYWSPDIKLTALDYMALRNQTELLKVIITPSLDIELHQTYSDLRADYYQNRAEINKEYLERVDTGSLSINTFGYRVNPVQMTRGNKEGNNAFI